MKIVLDKIWRQADSANQSGSINEKHHWFHSCANTRTLKQPLVRFICSGLGVLESQISGRAVFHFAGRQKIWIYWQQHIFNKSGHLVTLLDWPCFDSNFFIYLYPIISKHFYGYWLRQQQKLKELRDKIEDATLLTREESHAIRLEIINARDEYEKTITGKLGKLRR
jgi:hypothetical protein